DVVRNVHQARRLLGERAGDRRVTMPECVNRHSCQEVEITLARDVPDLDAGAALHDYGRLTVIGIEIPVTKFYEFFLRAAHNHGPKSNEPPCLSHTTAA